MGTSVGLRALLLAFDGSPRAEALGDALRGLLQHAHLPDEPRDLDLPRRVGTGLLIPVIRN